MPTPSTDAYCPFTDFEEGILFDSDDPDFERPWELDSDKENFYRFNFHNAPSPSMSLTSLATTNRSHSFGSISSLEDLSLTGRQPSEPTVLSIEELRTQLNSCFTCGVSWYDDHVSLDCAECGGYSLERPCVLCDGKCHSVWKRDLTMSHASGKARWLGECAFHSNSKTDNCDRILKEISASDKLYDRRINY